MTIRDSLTAALRIRVGVSRAACLAVGLAVTCASPGCASQGPTTTPVCTPAPPAETAVTEPAEAGGQCVVASGDASGDRSPPRITHALMAEKNRVRLTLSEPIAGIGKVNPNAFRLSVAVEYAEDDYAYCYYNDPFSLMDGGGKKKSSKSKSAPAGGSATSGVSSAKSAKKPAPASKPAPSSSKTSSSSSGSKSEAPNPLRITAIDTYGVDEPSVIGLVLDRAIPEDLCAEVNELRGDALEASAEGTRAQAGLFLHYAADPGDNGVRDRAGNQMRDIGPSWALNSGAAYEARAGVLPIAHIERLIPIECHVGVDPDDGDPMGGTPDSLL